jgi:hypothetical protein
MRLLQPEEVEERLAALEELTDLTQEEIFAHAMATFEAQVRAVKLAGGKIYAEFPGDQKAIIEPYPGIYGDDVQFCKECGRPPTIN